MFFLSRKRGQEVVIGPDIRLTVLAIHGKQVRLGITAPGTIPIYRAELLEVSDCPDQMKFESAVLPIANAGDSFSCRDSS